MNNTPNANYLYFTAPEMQRNFRKLMKQVPQFQEVPDPLIQFIYRYSKFQELHRGDRPIRQGMFDQDIYILIKGRLDVFLEVDGYENLIDTITEPFSIFGERCILGEPRGASIQAAENGVVLLGIDISQLPDFVVDLEYPEQRGDDLHYAPSREMYGLFASVLTDRLENLIQHHQLLQFHFVEMQRANNMKRSNKMHQKIFRQFVNNQLPSELRSHRILSHVLQAGSIKAHLNLPEEDEIDTQVIYGDLMKLAAQGKLPGVHTVLYDMVHELSKLARFSESYQLDQLNWMEKDGGDFSLSGFFTTLHHEFMNTGLIQQNFSTRRFIDLLLERGRINSHRMIQTMEEEYQITKNFDVAWLNFLVCKESLSYIHKLNQMIARITQEISDFSKIQDPTHRFNSSGLVGEFMQFYDHSVSPEEKQKEIKSFDLPEKSKAAQDGIDDLLSNFGL